MNNNVLIGALLAVLAVVVIGMVVVAGRNAEPTTSPLPTSFVSDEEQIQQEDEPSLEDDMILGTPVASPVVGTVSPSPAAPVAGAVKEFTVTGSNFMFDPSQMRVKLGDRVRVTFVNAGGTHDWKIDEFNVGTKVIQGGQQETVEFVADRAGQFEYYCSVGTHRQMGMRGTLTVEP
jgi:plastocyanin